MAVYKIFPVQDTTLYSDFNTTNTGLDAILDLSKSYPSLYTSQSTAARPIVKFSSYDITKITSNYIGSSSYSASLNLYLANATGIPVYYSIEVRPVSDTWTMGTGQYGDSPINTTGASWLNKDVSSPWTQSLFPLGVTASYKSGNPGGGNWYTGSVYTQSYGPYDTKDINIDVTGIVKAYVSGSYTNNGFLLKNADSIEFNPNYTYVLQYFSRDTNTIYPPSLNFKWDDSVYDSTITNVCTTGNVNLSFSNINFSYTDDEVRKVRINVRDKFPVRTFTTSSLYTNQKFLPTSSYWSLLDYKTGDIVIDFDTTGTKISADTTSNYFNMYMNGLEPGRYYKFLVKSTIGSETKVFDQDYIFKVE